MNPGPYHHLAALVRQKREEATMHSNATPLKDETLTALQKEVVKAKTKHPEAKLMLPALMEEVGELAKGYMEEHPVMEVKLEALHCAVVALRIFEEGGL